MKAIFAKQRLMPEGFSVKTKYNSKLNFSYLPSFYTVKIRLC